jgi:hypothetical protein
MKTRYVMISAILMASMSFHASAEVIGTEAPAADQAMIPAPGAAMTQAEMMQRMQEMRQQQMEMMQGNRPGRPMMGPGGGMMNPEMMQRMQEMHQQRMEMMQANRQGRPMMGPGGGMPGAEATQGATEMQQPQAPAETGGQGVSCEQMHARHGMGGMHRKGMKKEMMAMKRQHMQAMEQRLANIENLMREAVELLKSR